MLTANNKQLPVLLTAWTAFKITYPTTKLSTEAPETTATTTGHTINVGGGAFLSPLSLEKKF